MIKSEPKPPGPSMSEVASARPNVILARRSTIALILPVLAVVALMAIPGVQGFSATTHSAVAPVGPSVHLAASAPGTAHGIPLSPALQRLAASDFSISKLYGSLGAPSLPASGSGSRAPASPLSSSANFWLNGSDCASFGSFTPFEPTPLAGLSVTQVGSSPTTLVAAGGSIEGVFNGSGGTPCTTIGTPSSFSTSHGYTELFRSTNGGQSWTSAWLPQNTTHWLNTADPTNGTLNWGVPTVVSTASGTVLASEEAIPNCWFNFTNGGLAECQFQLDINKTYDEPWSIAVARSTNGGQSWGAPVQAASIQPIHWLNFTPTCQAQGLADGLYYWQIPEDPTIAVNPVNGVAVAAWSVLQIVPDMATCQIVIGAMSVNYTLSTDNGLTWGPVHALATGFSAYPEVSIGPAPTYPITVAYMDGANGTATGVSFATVHSTNNGTTWSTPKDVTVGTVDVIRGISAPFAQPEDQVDLQQPSLATDSGASSAYKGYEYIAWSDNLTSSSYAGYPGIEVITSTNGGGTWSNPVQVTASGRTDFFEPAVAVDPSGNVWITYYGYNTATGAYGVYGVVSTNGGSTWSPQFPVTDTLSVPATNLADLGVYSGLAATSNGVYPVWLDCRVSTCSSAGDLQAWTANVHAVTISAVGPAFVNATVTTSSVQTTSLLPETLGWDNVSTHTVSVPQYLPDSTNSSDVWGFQGWSGAATSTNTQVSVTYSGTSNTLVATYAELPAAVLRGTFAPAISGASLKMIPSGGGASVTVPLTALNATLFQYALSVAGGLSYTLNATAPNYQANQVTIPTSSSGGTYWTNFSLAKATGTITGILIPATATLTVNDVAQTVNAQTGLFSVPVPWGTYWVNASQPGYTSFSENVVVAAGATVHVPVTSTSPIQLFGGNITGIVNKIVTGLVVKIDNQSVTVNAGGTFTEMLPGGYHTVAATAPGYNLSYFPSVYVAAGSTKLVNISLTNTGWISGIIAPIASVPSAKLFVYNHTTGGNYVQVLANGSFNATLLRGGYTYTVNVTSTGYNSYQTTEPVTAGNGSALLITLTKQSGTQNCTVTGTCTTTHDCTYYGNCTTTTSNNNISLTTVIIIVVVIVLVAVIAAVLLMRRRGGGSQSDEQGSYAEGDASQMPKLQADGSMGPPPPQG